MATTKPKAAGPATQGLRIVSRPDSFWRCGYHFTSEGRTIPLSDLTDEMVDRLKKEKMLVVTEVDIKPEPEAKTT